MVRVKDQGDLYIHQDANWNVIALILDSPPPASRESAYGGRGLGPLRRVKDSVVERYTYTPYGQLIVHQETGFGDRDGDGDVDATDKGTVGVTCTGTVSGACRILDLDFDGDYDSTDATLFDSLPQGLARHPGRFSTGVSQPFAHEGDVDIGAIACRAPAGGRVSVGCCEVLFTGRQAAPSLPSALEGRASIRLA